MMRRLWLAALALVSLTTGAPLNSALELELPVVHFPAAGTVELEFIPRRGAPKADLGAEVKLRKERTQVEIIYDSMKPAFLFGGDVTCYVLWAISEEGVAENLGELRVPNEAHALEFSTAERKFALLVTAESHSLVHQPSELAVFHARPSPDSEIRTSPLVFSSFAPAPSHPKDSITELRWESKLPFELVQARRAYELALRLKADLYAPVVIKRAAQALGAADEIAEYSPRSRKLLDHARRSALMCNVAIQIALHRLEDRRLARQIEERDDQIASLQERLAEADARVRKTRELAAQARAELQRVRLEKERAAEDSVVFLREKLELEKIVKRLRDQKMLLEEELKKQETDSKSRLQDALSYVGEVRQSDRGLVLNLPGILFRSNEASLRPEAGLAFSKLAGILLLRPELHATIEGHTDSTGSAEHNLRLSQDRAVAVSDFLEGQTVPAERLEAIGYGMDRPIADNRTPEGRRRNRRVEILIRERRDISN